MRRQGVVLFLSVPFCSYQCNMGVLSCMCCVVPVIKVSCASVASKFRRIRVVVIRIFVAVRRFVLPFLDVCCLPPSSIEH